MTIYFKDGTNSGTTFSLAVALYPSPTDASICLLEDAGGTVYGGTPLANIQYYTIA